jgi:two-component system sensor histidine kinase BaeS
VKLRLRLAVTTAAVAVPVVGALVWFDAVARHSAAEAALAGLVRHHLHEPDGRAACEAAPHTWGGVMPPPRPSHDHGPGPGHGHGAPPGPAPKFGPPPGVRVRPPVLFAYDETMHSQHPGAPALPDVLVDRIEDAEVATARWAWRGDDVEILVRMPWATGPCAFVLARGSTAPGFLGTVLPPTWVWLAPLLAVVAAVFLAVGPVVARIRRLTDAVRRSASAGYASPVDVGGRDEVAELAHAFDAAGREVRAQLAEKDRREQALRHFLANATHDVMIPLTVLKGHLSALQDRLTAGEPIDRTHVVAAMDEAHYIAAIVHNLGITAKLDSTTPQLQRTVVDLEALLARVIARHRPIARQLQVGLESAPPGEPLATEADVTLLEQAVSNLVYNAIRHNRPGGHVAVLLERRGPEFRLRVLDDGPGIPADQLERLVERGVRGDSARSRAPDGQGLGLHIARRVAHLHGMRLTLGPSEYGGLQVDLEGPRHDQ